jgi:cell division protein DivIC
VKIVRIIFAIFSNRYLLATTAFVVWVVFFDDSNFFIQHQRKSELDELNKKIEYYKTQVTETKQELSNLQNDPVMLEKYAREKYFMKRANEEVFVFDSTSTVPQIR